MSMYIESLQVSNVGPFDELDATFNPKMNVIVGANGVGKTSLLRCIAYCLTNHGMENIRMRKDAMLKVFCVQDEKKYIYGADHLVDKNQDYRTFNANNWELTFVNGYESVLIFQEKDYNLLAIGAFRYFPYHKLQGMMREDVHSERRKAYLRQNPSYLDSIEMPNVKQWMINRYFQIEKNWAVTEKKNWNKIIKSLPIIAPTESDFQFNRIERELEPIFSLNGRECYLEELSSGFRSVLSIVFMIVDWIEGINEGESALIENAVGTVLIDEIDAHLHPSWQATILGAIRKLFPKLQFIVTTHSPSVLMSVNAGEVMLFNNDNGKVIIKPIDQSYGAWQINDVLTNVMKTPSIDRISINKLLKELDCAFKDKSLDNFKRKLKKLKSILGPSDPILKVYDIKLAQLQLSYD